MQQVAFTRAALGSSAVPCPEIDIGPAFGKVVNAALGSRATNYAFNPYTSDLHFLLGKAQTCCTGRWAPQSDCSLKMSLVYERMLVSVHCNV